MLSNILWHSGCVVEAADLDMLLYFGVTAVTDHLQPRNRGNSNETAVFASYDHVAIFISCTCAS